MAARLIERDRRRAATVALVLAIGWLSGWTLLLLGLGLWQAYLQ